MPVPDSTARPEDVVRDALDVLYSYTSDSANPPIEGRSVTRAAGLVALAALVAERDALKHVVDCADTPLMRDVLRERDEAQERADRLAEALRLITESGIPGREFRSPVAFYIHLQSIARAALAGGTGQAHGGPPDPTSGRVPTATMYEHARRLSKERKWKDVQP